LVLGARRTDRIQLLADELTGKGGKTLAVTTDVTHYQVKFGDNSDGYHAASTPPW
jgi:NADP-dependent 3-hydroxy acid dehydrogenase YdfG